MENFLTVTDVIDELKVSKSKAYQIIRLLNQELKDDGFYTVQGKVNKSYFRERLGIIRK